MQSRPPFVPVSSQHLILVVEDHHDSATVLRMVLEKSGYLVHSANSMTSARGRVNTATYDLVICDILLPDGTGWELIREWRLSHTFKAIALSGLAMKADAAASLNAGFDRHLNKPFNITHLRLTIAEMLVQQQKTYTERSMPALLTLPCTLVLESTHGTLVSTPLQ